MKFGAQQVEDAPGRSLKRPIDGVPAGAGVSAAAKGFSDAGDVDRTLAAEADAKLVAGQFPEEGCDLDAVNAERVVRDPFAIFLCRLDAAHVVPRDVHPRQAIFNGETR